MKIGFLFPGQGAQTIGMGKDLYENFEEVRNIYERVEKITGIDIKEISFEGDEKILNETQNTQLGILTESLGILEVLKNERIKAEMTSGLSLGEYTALIEDNIFDFETGVKIVQKRGEIMREYTPEGNWKMAAILGLDKENVNRACKNITSGFVQIANYNTVGQIVISGNEEAVMQAGELAKRYGAKKVCVLNTSGPFHTIKMEKCSEMLKKELERVNINHKNSKVIKNLDGMKYAENDDVVEILSKHIMSPVQFTKDLETMYKHGIDTFIEIGPGKTLSQFVKRMKFERQINIMNINDVDSLKNTIMYIKNNL